MTRAPPSVAEVLRDVSRALRAARVDWYVFGAQALALHGLPRFTADLDVTVLPGARTTKAIVAALGRAGLRLRTTSPGFIERTRVLPMVHASSRLPVDVVLGGPGLEELFAVGAKRVKVGRTTVPVASLVHLVVMKLLAGRPKDLEDVRSLLDARASDVDERELEPLFELLREALGDDVVRDRFRALRR